MRIKGAWLPPSTPLADNRRLAHLDLREALLSDASGPRWISRRLTRRRNAAHDRSRHISGGSDTGNTGTCSSDTCNQCEFLPGSWSRGDQLPSLRPRFPAAAEFKVWRCRFTAATSSNKVTRRIRFRWHLTAPITAMSRPRAPRRFRVFRHSDDILHRHATTETIGRSALT